MLFIPPPTQPQDPPYLKTLATLQALSDSPSAFFTMGAPGDAEREELLLGTQLFDQPAGRRGYLYMLRGHLGRRAPEVMPPDQLGKQYLIAAQLFAQARNDLAKAKNTGPELVAYFLAVRCSLHSHVALPDYLDQMTSRAAEFVGGRAEALATDHLQKDDLAGFLAFTTIAHSAYEDNTLPLGKAELARYEKLPYASLVTLHEYLKARKDKLAPTAAALVQRAMGLLAATHQAELPSWLQEVVGKAPARAATAFLQEAAELDKKRKPAAAGWWWAQAAEALRAAPELEAWQQPFLASAPVEAAKRLGEVAVKEWRAQQDFHAYAHAASTCHRLVRSAADHGVAWLDSFRVEEARNVQAGYRRFLASAGAMNPNITTGLGVIVAASATASPSKQVNVEIRAAIKTLTETADPTSITA